LVGVRTTQVPRACLLNSLPPRLAFPQLPTETCLGKTRHFPRDLRAGSVVLPEPLGVLSLRPRLWGTLPVCYRFRLGCRPSALLGGLLNVSGQKHQHPMTAILTRPSTAFWASKAFEKPVRMAPDWMLCDDWSWYINKPFRFPSSGFISRS